MLSRGKGLPGPEGASRAINKRSTRPPPRPGGLAAGAPRGSPGAGPGGTGDAVRPQSACAAARASPQCAELRGRCLERQLRLGFGADCAGGSAGATAAPCSGGPDPFGCCAELAGIPSRRPLPHAWSRPALPSLQARRVTPRRGLPASPARKRSLRSWSGSRQGHTALSAASTPCGLAPRECAKRGRTPRPPGTYFCCGKAVV